MYAGQGGSENALMMKRAREFTGPASIAFFLNSDDGKCSVSVFFFHIALELQKTNDKISSKSLVDAYG